MCPLISSLRIASACSAASSAVSANLTPPAFIRPPLSTCDLITVGPPISSATSRASSAVVQKPYLVTGIPASSTILRASYSKNLISGGEPYTTGLGYFGSMSRLLALTAVALLSILSIGCGGTVIDSSKTEDALQHNLETSLKEKVSSVQCPSNQ